MGSVGGKEVLARDPARGRHAGIRPVRLSNTHIDTVGEVGWAGGGRVCCGGSPRRRPAMSLKPSPIQPVPEGTARVARAAFRKGNPLLKLRDELGAIFADADFADLFPRLGQPGLP